MGKILRNPRGQGLLLVIVTAFFYIYFSRSTEPVTDFQLIGNYAYVSVGAAGIRVVDITNRETPIRVGGYDTYGYAQALVVANNKVYVADGDFGLVLFDLKDPESLEYIGTQKTLKEALDVAILDKFAYVADDKRGITIVQVEDKNSPRIVRNIPTRGAVTRVIVAQKLLFAAVNRKLLKVYDLSNPSEPKEIGSVDVGDTIHDIFLDMSRKLAFISADERGLVIIDLSDIKNIKIKITYNTPGVVQGFTIADLYGYLADGNKGLRLLELNDFEKIRELGNFPSIANVTKIQVFGDMAYYADGADGLRFVRTSVLLKSSKEGQSSGTEFEDVQSYRGLTYAAAGKRGLRVLRGETGRLQETNFFDTPGHAFAVAFQNDWAYIADGDGGLQGVNIAKISEPLTLLSSADMGQERDTQDVAVEGNIIYLAQGRFGFWTVDKTDPQAMRVVGKERLPGPALGLSILGKNAYVACGEAGLCIIDAIDVRIPTLMGRVELADAARAVATFTINDQLARESGRDRYNADPNHKDTKKYALVAASSAGLTVVDVTNPKKPEIIGSYSILEGNALDVSVNWHYAYLVDDIGVLHVLEIADPRNPVLIQQFTLETPLHGVTATSDNRVYLAAYPWSIHVLDLRRQPPNLMIASYFDPPTVKSLYRGENYLFTAGGFVEVATGPIGDNSGLTLLDITDPKKMREISHYRIPAKTYHVTLVNNIAWIAGGADGLHAVDYSDPQKPKKLGSLRPSKNTPADARWVLVEGNQAYIANGTAGFWVVDISDPAKLREKSWQAVGQPGAVLGKMVKYGEYIFVAAGSALIPIWVLDPARPVQLPAVEGITDVRSLTLHGQYALVATGSSGILILDVSHPQNVLRVAEIATPKPASDVAMQDVYAFVTMEEKGLTIYDLSDLYNPVEVGTSDLIPRTGHLIVEGPLSDAKDQNFYLTYSANEADGFILVKSKKDAKFQSIGTYEPPGTASTLQVVRYWGMRLDELAARLKNPAVDQLRKKIAKDAGEFFQNYGITFPDVGLSVKAEQTSLQLIFQSGVLCLLGFLFWAVVLVQFALPVRSLNERGSAGSRIITFFRERHGIASRVINGQLYQDPENVSRWGPGVLVVDLASAVVLEGRMHRYSLITRPIARFFRSISNRLRRAFHWSRQEIPQLRVIGPGLHFTRYERIRGIVDLRPQIRFNKDVVASSRDGIEVKSNISCIFSLGQKPDVLQVTYYQDDPLPKANPPVEMEPVEVEKIAPTTKTGNMGEQVGSDQVAPSNNQLESASNLRVIVIKENNARIINGVSIIEDFSDLLDADDKEEIHQFIQMSRKRGRDALNVAHLPREIDPPFYVDPQRVFAAVSSRAQTGNEGEPLEWNSLPAIAATEIFRDMLSGEKYDYLYQPEHPSQYPVKELKTRFDKKVRNLGVLSFQFVQRKDGSPLKKGDTWNPDELISSPVQELRTPKVLRARGIKVIFAGFSEMHPVKADVRERLLETWKAAWQRDADVLLADRDLRAMRIRTVAKVEAQREMAQRLSEIFQVAAPTQEVLALRVLQALENAATDPNTRQLLPAETINWLKNLKDWLLPDEDQGNSN